MITVDFASVWFEPIKNVFPNSEVQICLFHVMQEITRALNIELVNFKKVSFDSFINTAKELARNTLEYQKSGNLLIINSKYNILEQMEQEFLDLINIVNGPSTNIIEIQIKQHITYLYSLTNHWSCRLAAELENRLPPNGLTDKNLKYYIDDIFKAFRKALRSVRRIKEQIKNEFLNVKSLILTAPKRLSDAEKKKLVRFLKLNPEFMKIRSLFLQIHNTLQFTPSKVSENLILNLKIWSNANEKLEAAINTLKKNATRIFTYTKFLKTDTDLKNKRRIRINRECDMKLIKEIKRRHCGFRSKENSRIYLESQLNCPVFINI